MNKLKIGLVGITGLALILSALIVTMQPASAVVNITLVGARDTKHSFHGRWLTLIYNEVFQRIGITWAYDAYSSARASALSDSGQADGEINRVSGYGNGHPNLLRVDEPHFTTRLVAYAVKPGITLNGWKSLENKTYLIEYRRGTQIVRKGLPASVNPENVSTVITAEQGLKKLIVGRTDIYIDVESLITEVQMRIDKNRYDPSGLYNAGLLAEDTLHMYVHKNRADLIPKIESILKALKQEGLIEKYRTLALEQK